MHRIVLYTPHNYLTTLMFTDSNVTFRVKEAVARELTIESTEGHPDGRKVRPDDIDVVYIPYHFETEVRHLFQAELNLLSSRTGELNLRPGRLAYVLSEILGGGPVSLTTRLAEPEWCAETYVSVAR